jgi:CubicO group peptidase (beta-lactamase class C family)
MSKDADEATQSPPAIVIHGYCHEDFKWVQASLLNQLKRFSGGGAVCIYHHGECVVDCWGGTKDAAGTQPWLEDTMAPSFSTTKGVASTLMHIMVDRGLLDYDDRVVTYWPEFGQAGKERITIRQVMSHQSGLYHIRQMIDSADRMLDWEHMVEAIEQARPIHRPGERTGYHGLTYGFLVGEILQRVTGKSFSTLVKDELATPLGLDGFYVGAPDEVHHRAAELIWPKAKDWASRITVGDKFEAFSKQLGRTLGAVGFDLDVNSLVDALAPRGISNFDFGAPETMRVAIPAGNGLFTARSLARMYAALAAGGQIDGVDLLSRQTLARATELQRPTGKHSVIPFDMRWRLGYHGIFTTRGVPAEAFGHFGFGGSGAWADPKLNLSFAMIVNCGMGSPFGDLRTARMSGAALACARPTSCAGWARGWPSAAAPKRS